MSRSLAGNCLGPRRLSRREILQVGGAGLLGLGLPRLLRHKTARGEGGLLLSSSSSTAAPVISTCGT